MKKENKTIDGVVDGTHVSDTNDDNVKKRRKYITLDKMFLGLIDRHINEHLTHDSFKPARSYELFVKAYDDNIKHAIKSMADKGLEESDFALKLKKTYKNRYFNIVK